MQIGSILLGLVGGLAFFLHGLEKLTSSLNSVAGPRLQSLLSAATRNVFWGALSGAILTALLQSSSLTTVLCVGFISAGLLNLRQAVGVIVGANIGTTVTAQLISLDLSALALPVVSLGIFLRLLARSARVRNLATVVFGLGLIFYGMELMTQATDPLRDYEPFIEGMKGLNRAWVGVLVGACFTALVQSSSATTGLVIVLGSQGFLTLPAAVAVVLGANVGSCVTAVVAAWSRGIVARQAAGVHVIFNVVGALVWWLLLDQLVWLSLALSGPDQARQIANAHTIFNVSNGLVFMMLAGKLAALVERLLPVPQAPDHLETRPLYLDPAHLTVPTMAMERVRLELNHLGQLALEVMRGDQPEELVDSLLPIHDAIVDYSRQVPREALSGEDYETLQELLLACNSLEHVGIALRELLDAERQLGTSPFLPEVEQYHRLVTTSLEQAVLSLASPDKAAQVREAKGQVRAYRDEAMRIAMDHLESKRPGATERYRHRVTVVDALRRIYYLASHIARAVQKREKPEA